MDRVINFTRIMRCLISAIKRKLQPTTSNLSKKTNSNGNDMKDYMTLREYVINPQHGITLDVAEKIRKYHVYPMNILRNKVGFPIIVSQNSGYRSQEHELSKGRSLTSAHLFQENTDRQDPGFGAADYRVADENWGVFIRELIDARIYPRLIFYPNSKFVHADYRYMGVDRFFYIMDGGITRVSQEKLIESVDKVFNTTQGIDTD